LELLVFVIINLNISERRNSESEQSYLKILHVIDCINEKQGGPSVSVPRLAEAQVKLGHQVTIACRDYAYLGSMVKAQGVEVRSVPSSRWAKGQGGWGCSFRKLVEQEAEKADVVHNHGVWLAANYYARRAAVKAGKPLVISPRGMLEGWSLGRSIVRKTVAWQLFERKNLESAALFHATADSEAEAIKTALRIKMKIKIKEPRIVVAPNGVDIPERIPNREALEARFAKLRGRRWILFMSRVHPKKGLLELAKAWMQIRESNPGWELVIAGPEQDKGYAEKLKKEGGREVIWTGELRGEEKWAALGNAEFLVLPSHSENFGIVVAESLAAGRPVVTTTGTPWGAARSEIKMKIKIKENNGGESMNLEERKCGVICEVTDLKRGLERMLEFSDKEREEMGARGRQWMKEKFSWEAGAERLIAGYKEIEVWTLD
jgi:glycosyltransferase involved in cell wall biosynthesis